MHLWKSFRAADFRRSEAHLHTMSSGQIYGGRAGETSFAAPGNCPVHIPFIIPSKTLQTACKFWSRFSVTINIVIVQQQLLPENLPIHFFIIMPGTAGRLASSLFRGKIAPTQQKGQGHGRYLPCPCPFCCASACSLLQPLLPH